MFVLFEPHGGHPAAAEAGTELVSSPSGRAGVREAGGVQDKFHKVGGGRGSREWRARREPEGKRNEKWT